MQRKSTLLAGVIGVFLVLVSVSLVAAELMTIILTWGVYHLPYSPQEGNYYCGPAVAQMWIYYSTYWYEPVGDADNIPQDTLYAYIQAHNTEGDPGDAFYLGTDPDGLKAALDYYAPNTLHSIRSSTTASVGTNDIVYHLWGEAEPAAALTWDGRHWMLVVGANFDYQGEFKPVREVYGVWVNDPSTSADSLGEDHYLTVSIWHTKYFTKVDPSK